ncbi:MAG: respiratory nitrate reductase subunit gamma [Phycisphaerales bacterium]|nr:respiratory nitrate reductase subunit gamma [Phycisphaerales bacterium]
MDSANQYMDQVLFAILPYVALATFFIGTIVRYRTRTFTYSSLSSQFLENQQHFWSTVPFHYGILVVLFGHFVAFLIPRQILWWNGQPARLFILEIAALIFGLMALFGMFSIFLRRITTPKVRVVTSPTDWMLYALLLVQIASGIGVAIFYPWGSSWFSAAATPYIWSILTLNPDISYIVGMPHLVKLHIVCASLLIGFFPFTRLVHVLVVPNPYLWRKPQVVRWNWNPRTIRAPRS